MKPVMMKYHLRFFAGSRSSFVSGFTLIEVLVAISIFSVVLLAAGTFLVSEVRNAARNQLVVDMQRDATLSMDTIGNRIREACVDDGVDPPEVSVVSNSVASTLYFDSSRTDSVTWQKNDDQLIFKSGGRPAVYLIDKKWEIRDFSAVGPTNSTWIVYLQVRVPGTESEFVLDSTFIPRNLVP